MYAVVDLLICTKISGMCTPSTGWTCRSARQKFTVSWVRTAPGDHYNPNPAWHPAGNIGQARTWPGSGRDAVALHREIAYVPRDVTLWPSLTVVETIDLLARMRGGMDALRRAELIERFDLDPTKKARTYSKGNRQKVSLISALSSRARLLLLDEPSACIDPLMEQVFRECMREASDRGVTVFISSHILSEMEALCDRLTIIRAGKTVESGTLQSMRHLSRTSITAELLGDPGDLGRIKGVEDVSIEGDTLRAHVNAGSLGEEIRVLGETGVRSLVSQPPTLEELFLRHYRIDGEGGAPNGDVSA